MEVANADSVLTYIFRRQKLDFIGFGLSIWQTEGKCCKWNIMSDGGIIREGE